MGQTSSFHHLGDPDRGVITAADIIRALHEGKRLENLTAGQVMTGPALTVDAKAPLERRASNGTLIDPDSRSYRAGVHDLPGHAVSAPCK